MTEEKILAGKLTRFLREKNVLDAFKNELSRNGMHAKNINDLAAFSIYVMREPAEIIRRSFPWRHSTEGFRYWDSLCHEFYVWFNSLPYEDEAEEPDQWTNMWED